MAKPTHARLIFPHQLFAEHLQAPANTRLILIEDDLLFKQLPFHKQKLMLHRASMRHFADTASGAGFTVEYLWSASEASMDGLGQLLARAGITKVSYYELVDDWLQQRLSKLLNSSNVPLERLNSPAFLTTAGQIEDYFSSHSNRMQHFYEWQRRRLNIMMDGDRPAGGKWSFDAANRKKLPRDLSLPPAYPMAESTYLDEARRWVEAEFAANPGESAGFCYPLTHEEASRWLHRFVRERLELFGPYEDAMVNSQGQLFHSVLSPLLNIGLLTPRQVVDTVLDYANEHEIPIESLEGFIRQIIGWREYMRATYVHYGRKMRVSNHLNFQRNLSAGWWDGSVGIMPIDTIIKRVLQTGYAHHIERLMVLGNSMVLLRIHPDEAYKWFMSLFVDAYDWVMVPNVYAMSQFAAGEMITTKPYVSGSNYIRKMSDFTAGDWTDTWDALYWQFVHDYRLIIENNHRSQMLVRLYDRFDDTKKQRIEQQANVWLRG